MESRLQVMTLVWTFLRGALAFNLSKNLYDGANPPFMQSFCCRLPAEANASKDEIISFADIGPFVAPLSLQNQ